MRRSPGGQGRGGQRSGCASGPALPARVCVAGGLWGFWGNEAEGLPGREGPGAVGLRAEPWHRSGCAAQPPGGVGALGCGRASPLAGSGPVLTAAARALRRPPGSPPPSLLLLPARRMNRQTRS